MWELGELLIFFLNNEGISKSFWHSLQIMKGLKIFSIFSPDKDGTKKNFSSVSSDHEGNFRYFTRIMNRLGKMFRYLRLLMRKLRKIFTWSWGKFSIFSMDYERTRKIFSMFPPAHEGTKKIFCYRDGNFHWFLSKIFHKNWKVRGVIITSRGPINDVAFKNITVSCSKIEE